MQLETWIDEYLAERLPAFLGRQRWFGSKTRPIGETGCEDLVSIPDAAMPLALVVVSVRYADHGSDRYAMIVAAVDDPSELPVIGQIGASTWAVEATALPGAARALVRALAAQSLHARRGGVVRRHDLGHDTEAILTGLSEEAPIKPLGAEQSNTSLGIDRRWVFKLIRKLDDGENPELEIGRFLSRTAFGGTPPLRGAWTWIGADGHASTMGLLHDWVENRGDGWTHVVTALAQPAGARGLDPLLHDLASLGTTTAALHLALASDAVDAAFRPRPVTHAEAQTWRVALRDRAVRAANLVQRLTPEMIGRARAMADSFVALAARWGGEATGEAVASDFSTIRVHGDYHLGQTLKTAEGFVVIDFEGEPARSIAERRRTQPAMKDVAGMLRSFDYAVATARAHASESLASTDPLPAMRRAFLDAYVRHAVAGQASFVPRERAAFDAWVNVFELERALYEIEYELNHRPDWVHIPLGGVLRLFGEPS
jgi:trehalose synthase-fused probable maltokinase